MAFPLPRPAPIKLNETASFRQCFDYYLERTGLSETKIADYIRINQPRLNKIANGTVKNVDIPTLVCICLALGLNEAEARDLLARRERAFSPANDTHRVYLELIRMYSVKELDYKRLANTPEKLLEEADDYLISKGKKELPIMNLNSKI